MDKVITKVIGLVLAVTISVICFFGCDNDVVKSFITPTSIETVSEYGTYFGSKAGGLAEDDANKIKVALDGIIKVIDANSVPEVFSSSNGTIDISSKIDKLPDVAKKYLNEAINIVNTNFVKVKGKIPTDKVPYVKAVFSGGLKGIDKYIGSLEEVSVNSGYETKLANKYAIVRSKMK